MRDIRSFRVNTGRLTLTIPSGAYAYANLINGTYWINGSQVSLGSWFAVDPVYGDWNPAESIVLGRGMKATGANPILHPDLTAAIKDNFLISYSFNIDRPSENPFLTGDLSLRTRCTDSGAINIAMGGSSVTQHLQTSTDAGTTWTRAFAQPGDGLETMWWFGSSGGSWIFTTDDHIYRSVDNGLNWTRVHTHTGALFWQVAFGIVDSKPIWIATSSDITGDSEFEGIMLWGSVDDGQTWYQMDVFSDFKFGILKYLNGNFILFMSPLITHGGNGYATVWGSRLSTGYEVLNAETGTVQVTWSDPGNQPFENMTGDDVHIGLDVIEAPSYVGDVAWNGELYCCVGSRPVESDTVGRVCCVFDKSTDGVTWSGGGRLPGNPGPQSFSQATGSSGIAASEELGVFVTGGSEYREFPPDTIESGGDDYSGAPGDAALYASADGENWIKEFQFPITGDAPTIFHPDNVGSGSDIYNITWNGSTFIAVGALATNQSVSDPGTFQGKILMSPTGSEWTEQTHDFNLPDANCLVTNVWSTPGAWDFRFGNTNTDTMDLNIVSPTFDNQKFSIANPGQCTVNFVFKQNVAFGSAELDNTDNEIDDTGAAVDPDFDKIAVILTDASALLGNDPSYIRTITIFREETV